MKRPQAWINWRTKVYERDGYRCVLCGRTGIRIDPHHILPKALFSALKYRVSNGATLCRRCHRRTFRKELQFVEILVTKIFGGMNKWILLRHWKMRRKVRKTGFRAPLILSTKVIAPL